jgi:hypothetical protein
MAKPTEKLARLDVVPGSQNLRIVIYGDGPCRNSLPFYRRRYFGEYF